MSKTKDQVLEEKLDAMIELLQNLLALELSKSSVPQGVICKRLHVTNVKVGKMLQGVKKE